MKRFFTAVLFFAIAVTSFYSFASYAPQNFTATVSGSSVNFSWSSVPATAICDGDVPCTFSNYVLHQTGVTLGMYNGEGLRIDNRSTTSFNLNNLPVGQHEFYLGSYYTYYTDEYEFFPTQKITVTISNGVPQTPASISATLSGKSAVVNWSAVQSATSYELQRNSANLTSVSTTGYTDSSAAAGSTNSYRVRACNMAGCSDWTTTQAVVQIPPIPSVPYAFGVDSLASYIRLSWQTTTYATTYDVRRDNVIIASPAIAASAGVGGYEDRSVTPGVRYSYTVRACGISGCGGWASAYLGRIAAIPASPGPISANQYGFAVRVDWNEVADATSYELQRDSSTLTTSESAPYDDTSIVSGATYIYRVRACNTLGCSDWVSSASLTIQPIPAAPASITATPGSSSIAVSWQPSSGASSYQLHRNSVPFASVSITTHTDGSVVKSTAYTYTVRACNSIGCSDWTTSSPVQLIAAPSSSNSSAISSSVRSSSSSLSSSLRSSSSSLRSSSSAISSSVRSSSSSLSSSLRSSSSSLRSSSSAISSSLRSSSSFPSSSKASSSTQHFDTDNGIVTSTPPSATPGSPVGALAGEFRVDESGSATYNMPIVVPEGVAGVKPQLSVNYNSQGGFGLLGIGTSLSGAGSISRCHQTALQDGAAKPITWGAEDRFCLNGQRLMLISGVYGTAGSMYKTEIDNFSLIAAVGGVIGNPDYFEVRAKDGSLASYGKTSNSKMSTPYSTFIWSLSQFEDNVGNRIDYTYEGNNTTGQRLASINYAYPTTKSSVNAAAKVNFYYEDRNDSTTSFIYTNSLTIGNEFSIKQTKRLASIRTFNTITNGEALVKRYAFGYAYNSVGQSRLSTATECTSESESSCYKPTLFTWAKATQGISSTPLWFNKLPSANSFKTHKFMDINGDGRQDLVWVRASGKTRYIEYGYKNSSSGGNLSKQNFSNNVSALIYSNVEKIEYFGSDASVKLEAIDYNNDGRDDLLVCSKTIQTSQNRECVSWDLFLSEPKTDGTWQLSSSKITLPFKSELIQFADINADGMVEAVEIKNNSISYYTLQKGTDTTSNTYFTFSGSPTTIPLSNTTTNGSNPTEGYEFYLADARFGDFDGDGGMDIAIPAVDTITPVDMYINRPWKMFFYALRGNQFAYDEKLSFKLGQYVAWPIQLQIVDINQDGIADLIFKDGLHDTDHFALNKGGVFSSLVELRKPTLNPEDPSHNNINIIDYNQDGYLDIIYHNHTKQRFILKEWSQSQQTFTTDIELPTERKKTSSYYFSDITGDGFSDLVEIKTDSGGGIDLGTYDGFGSSRHNKIYNINDGMGRVTEIEYGSLANSTNYSTLAGVNTTTIYDDCANVTSGSFDPNCNQVPIHAFSKSNFYEQLNNPFPNPTAAPILELAGPMPIVIAVSTSAPTAQNKDNLNKIAYHYHHARLQAGGRGFLGFEKITTHDVSTGVATQTTYHQNWPFIGLTKKTLVTTASGNKLSEAENTWVAEIDSFSGQVPRVFLDKTTETSYDLKDKGAAQGASLQTVTTDNDYDIYGNLTRLEVIASGSANTSKKITVNQYYQSDWELRMGRLDSSSTTTQRNSDPAVIRTSKFEYYGQFDIWPGMLKKEIVEPGINQQVVEYEYDLTGNQTVTRKTANVKPGVSQTRKTEVIYDTSKRFVETTLDSLGNITSGVIERHPVYGAPTKIRDANGTVTTIKLNDDGTEQLRSDATGAWVHTDKAFCGGAIVCPPGARFRVATSVSGGGKSFEYFDILGRTMRSSKVMFDGRESHIDTEYDNLGRITRKSEPYFTSDAVYWTVFNEYDLINRPIKITSADNTETTNTYTGYKSLVVADSTGKKLTRTEERNSFGNLVKVTDHMGGTITYGYDPLGNLTSATTAASGKTVVVRMCYDKLGRKIGMHDPDKGGFLGNASEACTNIESKLDSTPGSKTAGWWFYKYNDFGELIEQTDTKRQVTTMEYDLLGRMIRRADKRADNTVEAHTRWYYDKYLGGSPATNTQLKLTGVVTSYNRIDENCSGANYCQTYTYDGISRLTDTVTYLPNAPTGYINTIKYDTIGRAFKQYDVLHGLVQTSGTRTQFNAYGYAELINDLTTGDVLQKTLSVNARGQIKEELRNNGAAGTTVYTYDNQSGRLTNQTTTLAGALFGIQNVTYAWDKLGNLSSRHNQSGNLAPNGSTAKKNLQESFCYDGLNRLIKSHQNTLSGNCNVSALDQDQEYDGLGNITRKVGMGTYTYSGKGPHAVTSTSNTGSYGYDDNGNQTTGASRTITYSTYDQPLKIVSGTTSTDFSYGPSRARFERKDIKSGVVTLTHYLGNVERIQVQGSNVVEWKRYIAGAVYTVRTTAANVIQTLDKSYLFNDHLGSLDVVTNAQGKITHSASFDAWGARRSGENWNSAFAANSLSLTGFTQPLTQRGFTGHEMLDDYGLIHMNGRIYDAKLARFLQADPFIQAATDTQSFNRYSYVMNNPLNTTDPSGFFFSKLWKEIKPFIGTIVAIVVTFVCPVCGPIVAGMIGGAASAAVNGGNILMGAAFGAFSGAAGGLGGIGGFFTRGMIGGMQTAMAGGKFGNGFAAAGIGGLGGVGKNPMLHFAQSAILGGVASEITGGKFKNGAATAAFNYVLTWSAQKYGPGGIKQSDDANELEPEHVTDAFKGNDKIRAKTKTKIHDDGTVEHIFDLSYENQSTISDEIVDAWASQIEKTFSKKFGTKNVLTVKMTKFVCEEMCLIMGGAPEITFNTVPASGCPQGASACAQVGGGTISFVAGKFAAGHYRFDTPSHEFAHAIGFNHDSNSTNSIRSYSSNRGLTTKDYQIMAQYYFGN
jgi:RHS repeat-associated protein